MDGPTYRSRKFPQIRYNGSRTEICEPNLCDMWFTLSVKDEKCFFNAYPSMRSSDI